MKKYFISCHMNQQVEPTRVTWKVSVIGAEGTGKSSLISRIVYDTPDYTSQFTSLTKKVVEFDYNGSRKKADLLFQELDPSPNSEKLLHGSNAIVVTVEITSEESLILADEVLKYVLTFERTPLRYMIATKLDRKYEAEIWDEELSSISEKYSTKYFKVSSKTGEGIQEFIDGLKSDLSSRIKKRK